MDRLSAVAGIIDRHGGLRVVVTQAWRMRHHVKKKEALFVVPDMQVKEPVPWDEIPWVIQQVEIHIARWIGSRNDPDAMTLGVKQYKRKCELKYPGYYVGTA